MSIYYNKIQNLPQEEQGGSIKIENPSLNREIQSEFRQNLGDTDRGEENGDTKINGEEENSKAKISSKNSVPEEEEGFKTPTSIDHKIPATTQCPPPPSKTRSQLSPLKPRAFSKARRRLRFVAAAEAETVLSTMSGFNVEKRRNGAPTAGGEIRGIEKS